ncbi:hypothetical protein PR048_020933 [Dryococelus australis]|uniref:Uncharacterized protein n=1 Tax=Dryococelus australis TaxID=614101 RepID=A0ABQ9GWU7_9NEOP|nr:hypothetical protein PR048_020933 [Dryococelus australis]
MYPRLPPTTNMHVTSAYMADGSLLLMPGGAVVGNSFNYPCWGHILCDCLIGDHGGRMVSLLASHQGEPGSIPGQVNEFPHVGIVPDDSDNRGSFPFPPPFHSDAAPYSPQSPPSTLNTSLLRAAQIFPLCPIWRFHNARRRAQHPSVAVQTTCCAGWHWHHDVWVPQPCQRSTPPEVGPHIPAAKCPLLSTNKPQYLSHTAALTISPILPANKLQFQTHIANPNNDMTISVSKYTTISGSNYSPNNDTPIPASKQTTIPNSYSNPNNGMTISASKYTTIPGSNYSPNNDASIPASIQITIPVSHCNPNNDMTAVVGKCRFWRNEIWDRSQAPGVRHDDPQKIPAFSQSRGDGLATQMSGISDHGQEVYAHQYLELMVVYFEVRRLCTNILQVYVPHKPTVLHSFRHKHVLPRHNRLWKQYPSM